MKPTNTFIACAIGTSRRSLGYWRSCRVWVCCTSLPLAGPGRKRNRHAIFTPPSTTRPMKLDEQQLRTARSLSPAPPPSNGLRAASTPRRDGFTTAGCGCRWPSWSAAPTIFSVYSYAKLGAKYPSRGGAAQFLIRCFGDAICGWPQRLSVPGLDHRHGAVLRRLRGLHPCAAAVRDVRLVGSGHRYLLIVAVLINMVGSKLVARSELFVVTIELVILAVFAVFGLVTEGVPGKGWPTTDITTGSACCSPPGCSTSPFTATFGAVTSA